LPSLQAFEVSAEEFKNVEQKQGTLLPLTAEKPALEVVKISKDMKVGWAGVCMSPGQGGALSSMNRK
jgi:hypothetical protein